MRTLKIFLIVSFCSTLLVIGCSKKAEEKKEATKQTEGGTITGLVYFPGEYPEPQKILINQDQHICGAFQYSEDFVVNEENKGLANVVISLANVTNGLPPQSETSHATIDQNGCRYVPHVQAVPVGTQLEVLNSDGILHNVHVYLNSIDPANEVLNKAQPAFLKKVEITLDKKGVYYFKCDIHEHMNAYIVTFDHPYFTVTDSTGHFKLENVPPGNYTVQAWHEVLGNLEKQVTVTKGQTSEVTFEILPNE